MFKERLQHIRFNKRLKAFYEKYERALVPGALLLGFVVDVVTFRTLKIETSFVVLGIHATLAWLAIIYSNIYDGRETTPHNPVLNYLRFLTPLLVQFTFGSLLSNALIFYWYSGSFMASWPIMILLIILMMGNEVFRSIYLRPGVQIAVYAYVLLSYFTLLFPYIFSSLDANIFILGGVVSTLIVLLSILLIGQFSTQFKEEQKRMALATLAVFVTMNLLYFLNIIPPIPLSIRDANVVINAEKGRTYVHTAIFAPTDLNTTIYHQWEYFDALQRKWVKSDRIAFKIQGGRDAGYRGYTYKTNLTPGKWRVTVETERGQVLGRIPFKFSPAPEVSR